MIIGVYGDVHLTKNMRTMQSIWDVTAMKSLKMMYDKFDELDVEMVVCLGDFFDAPRIEAKSMQLVMPILDMMEEKTYPTYILLGNHEAESTDSNILEFLSSYNNITPVTTLTDVEHMIFVPYYEDLESITDIIKHKIVFTHHDIYGSALASGKTNAFFGADPAVLSSARLVMNGHVHLKSKPAHNILNTGSLLVSQQGELRVGEYPSYYILDTHGAKYHEYNNEHSMIYLTIDVDDVSRVSQYDPAHLVLKVEYAGDMPENWINTAHTSWRKKITSIEGKVEESVSTKNFDMRNYLVEYIKHDASVEDSVRDSYVNTGLELLS